MSGDPGEYDMIGLLRSVKSLLAAPSLGAGAATEAKQDAQIADLGAVNETAPANDTAAAGLNGRLQRIAQRLTSVLAILPTARGPVTGANSLPVVPPTDGFAIVGSRAAPFVTGNIPNTTSAYTISSNAKSIGGLVTIPTGLPAGTVIAGGLIKLKLLIADLTTSPTLNAQVFSANPTGSTYTDNVVVAAVAADRPKIASSATITFAGPAGGIGVALIALQRMAVDADGNIFLALIATSSAQYVSANAIDYTLAALY